MNDIKVILLDIGGVLVEYVGAKKLVEWIDGGIDSNKLSNIWSNSRAVCMFETGKCNSRKFAESFIDELKLPILPDEFLNEFILFPKGYYPEAESILRRILEDYSIACFSNTNNLQWNILCSRHGLDKYFFKKFLSFEMA